MNNQHIEEEYTSMTDRVRFKNRISSSTSQPILSNNDGSDTPMVHPEVLLHGGQHTGIDVLCENIAITTADLGIHVLPNDVFVILAVDRTDIFREKYVFPAVRGIPASDELRSLFIQIFSVLVKHLVLLPNEASVHCKRVIFSIRFKRGQRHHESIIRDIRRIIGINSFDTVSTNGFFNGVQNFLNFVSSGSIEMVIISPELPSRRFINLKLNAYRDLFF